MPSKFKERFARLGRVSDVDRVASGSPAVFTLRRGKGVTIAAPIDACLVLAQRGLSLARAKRLIEQLMTPQAIVAVELPHVEDKVAVVRELKALKIVAYVIRTDPVDVRAIREKLGVSQSQFALMHNLSLDTLQKWESGERVPDRAAMNYLREIELSPVVPTLGQQDLVAKFATVGTGRSKRPKPATTVLPMKRRERA